MAKYINSDSIIKGMIKYQFESQNSPMTKYDLVDELLCGDVVDAKHGEWISCDERLPDKKGEYLVSYHPCYWDFVDKKVMVGVDTFRGKTKWAKEKYQRVIAWMPKPKPYVERKETDGTSI